MKIQIFLAVAAIFYLAGCTKGADSPWGFSLPEGDAKQGELVFMEADCLACHSLKGFEDETEKELAVVVALGGEETRVKTYADLVTSIINPSHKLAKGYEEILVSDLAGKSKMRNYNSVLTVGELIDLVTFLQPHYTIKVFEPTLYPNY